MQPMSNSSSSAWKLDKILPRSRWPKSLTIAASVMAAIAVLLSGLSLYWTIGLLALILLFAAMSWRKSVAIASISVSPRGCTLRLSDHQHIKLEPPYRSAAFVWWISVYQPNGYTGRWFWLYRDQFSKDEWRQLNALLHWSDK